jgi:hypothetical protein
VSPILGIWASQNYVRIPPTSYESIATQTVGSGGTSGVTFSSIPSTFKHLQIRGIGRASTSQSGTSNADITMYFNGDTSGSYARHRLIGDGSSASSAARTSSAEILWSSVVSRSTSASNIFGGFIIDILDYQNTSKNKTVRLLGGADLNGSAGAITLQSGLYTKTDVISSIYFTFETDSNPNPVAQYSQFALYGIRG